MDYLYRIEKQVWKAQETDYIMPIWLPLIPSFLGFVSVILMIVFSFYAWIGSGVFYYHYNYEVDIEDEMPLWVLFILLSIVTTILNFYVVYKLVWRRSEHFKRTYLLYTVIADYLESKGYNKEAEFVKDQLLRMRYEQELEKNPVLWAILSISVPFISYYVYHFLNKDFVKHDRSEHMILEKINKIFKEKGLGDLEIEFTNIGKFPERDTVLYIIVSLVSLGLFNLYWLYTLADDPNKHFKEHKILEKKLYSLLEKLPENQ